MKLIELRKAKHLAKELIHYYPPGHQLKYTLSAQPSAINPINFPRALLCFLLTEISIKNNKPQTLKHDAVGYCRIKNILWVGVYRKAKDDFEYTFYPPRNQEEYSTPYIEVTIRKDEKIIIKKGSHTNLNLFEII